VKIHTVLSLLYSVRWWGTCNCWFISNDNRGWFCQNLFIWLYQLKYKNRRKWTLSFIINCNLTFHIRGIFYLVKFHDVKSLRFLWHHTSWATLRYNYLFWFLWSSYNTTENERSIFNKKRLIIAIYNKWKCSFPPVFVLQIN
jgi:hypothetical protein